MEKKTTSEAKVFKKLIEVDIGSPVPEGGKLISVVPGVTSHYSEPYYELSVSEMGSQVSEIYRGMQAGSITGPSKCIYEVSLEESELYESYLTKIKELEEEAENKKEELDQDISRLKKEANDYTMTKVGFFKRVFTGGVYLKGQR